MSTEAASPTPQRVHVTLTPDVVAKANTVAARLHGGNVSDTLRSGVILLHALLEILDEGGHVYIDRPHRAGALNELFLLEQSQIDYTPFGECVGLLRDRGERETTLS